MKNAAKTIFLGILVIIVFTAIYFGHLFNIIPQKTYSGEFFGIEAIYSEVDFNEDGVDDFTAILFGARNDAQNRPKYDGSYIAGGYPPDNIGVCTDVIWRAFKEAGYNLREMIDKDIINRPEAYPHIEHRDSNIDFRRVPNLRIFYEEYSIILTTDIDKVAKWQPGDIVIFRGDKHIGIISDRRNKHGHPLVIHNGGQPIREEDYFKRDMPTGHYRFDSSLIPEEVLVRWQD